MPNTENKLEDSLPEENVDGNNDTKALETRHNKILGGFAAKEYWPPLYAHGACEPKPMYGQFELQCYDSCHPEWKQHKFHLQQCTVQTSKAVHVVLKEIRSTKILSNFSCSLHWTFVQREQLFFPLQHSLVGSQRGRETRTGKSGHQCFA